MTMQLNPMVGVAPGTTTMTFGHGCGLGDCPPDELWRYTLPPQVVTGLPSGGVAPDSAAAAITPPVQLNPYATESQLKGLGQASPNWSLVLTAGIATLAIVLGIGYLRRRRQNKA